MLFNRKNDKSIDMSMPPEKELYGVKIVKLTVARYIKVLNALETLPKILTDMIIPDKSGIDELLTSLAKGDKGFLERLFTGLLISAPTEISLPAGSSQCGGVPSYSVTTAFSMETADLGLSLLSTATFCTARQCSRPSKTCPKIS